jgi:hypothetical protein
MQFCVSDRGKARADFPCKCGKRRDILVRGDGLDAIAMRLLLEEIDGRRADRIAAASVLCERASLLEMLMNSISPTDQALRR